MKKSITSVLIVLLLTFAAFGQKTHQVPFDEIQEIANRNAQALWGDVYPAEPIPYYGFDDEIVAWRFNYSIGKPFPSKEEMRNQTNGFESEKDSYNQWGGDDFGRILIGARNNMPVLLEYSRCLSAEYALGNKLERLAETAFQGKESLHGKIYYLNHFNTWHQMISDNDIKYVCTSPTGGIIDESEFTKKRADAGFFCETGDFKYQWESYKNGFTAATDGDKYIPNHECMPFYDWSYGCSPTAAAMLFAWYDYRSLRVSSKYSYFVGWHYQRFDNVENETDYNVSNLQLDLALAMSTDTMTGSTQSYNIDNGMSWVANHERGYSFDVANRYTLLWTRLTDDIDAGKPLVVSIPGHSTTGVGYNGSTDMAITHYTHDPPNHLMYVSRWSIDMITRVSSGGQKGSAIQLIWPVGDRRYNNDGEGEVYSAGNYAEIRWYHDTVPESWVDLFYSTDGGHSFDEIVTNTENDGLYNWLIPNGISSTSCRVIAYLRTSAMEPYIAGADGSKGNFIIDNAGAIQTMVDGDIYEVDDLPEYYLFEHNDLSWAVIGNHSEEQTSYYEMQIFDDDDFNQTPLITSAYGNYNNFIVMDGNHVPATPRGVKLCPSGAVSTNYLQYEGGNENLALTPGGTLQLNWTDNKIVEMYDVHLVPGQYFIKTYRISGDMDVDIAFFKSTAGSRFKRISDADYLSDNWGGVEDSFVVEITTEDDYGLCLFSKTRGTGMLGVKIDDAYIWTGEEDSNWHNSDNWVGGVVPGPGSNVVIPNKVNDPIVSTADAVCNKISLLQNAILTITANDLVVNGDLTINGNLRLMSPTVLLVCYGDIMVASSAQITADTDASIWVYGDWTFGEGSNPHFDSGIVDFKGTSNSIIYIQSENAWFYDLKISKTAGAWVAYDNCIGIEPLRIKNQFILYNGATFVQWALHDVIFEGPFLSYAGSQFHFQNGTVRFERVGSGGISIFSESGSYFNDVVVSVDDWLGLSSDIEIHGDLLLEDGMFKTLGYDVYIKGNWYNNSGFDHDNSRVIFNGTGIQEVTGTNFWELELNKTGGELRVHESTVSVQHYDWTLGTVRVNGGWFQLNDLEDPGIYGTVIVTSGQFDLHQDPGEYLDLNGNLQISGGAMNIYGGNGDSFWPFSANASFTMSDGILDFKSNGLRIHNSATYSLTENITGGVIRLNGSLTVVRTDFNPTGGTMYFYGYTEDETVSVATGSNLFGLEVDKSSKKSKALAKTLTASGTLDLNGDFIITGGNFEAPTKMYVGGSFINTQSPYHFDELTGEVVLDGSVNQVFNQEETFYKLTINKPGDGTVTVANDVVFTVLNTLLVDKGNIVFDPGSTLMLDGNFDINYLGNIYFDGEAGNEITVTSASKSRYGFDVSGGGYISAKNTVFNNMDADGIYLHSGCYVDSENAFSGCKFSSGAPGGTLITWDNGAEVVVHDAVFPTNSTGCTFNVKKTTNSGRVFFDLATGPFSGTAFESDPFSRIDWEYVPPLTIPFTETWVSGSYETQHWAPESTNWIISDASGNPFPSASFQYAPRIYNYSVPLRSHLLDGSDVSDIYLKYDIRYVKFSAATLEQFKVQVVLQSGDFITLATYNNTGGSFGFLTAEFDISDFADGEIFYLRFTAFGADSWNIDGWFIDNIQVSGNPPAPGKLKGIITDQISGLPIENATVTIDGTPYTALSSETGEYSILNLPAAIYNVSASTEGYEPATAEGIVILSGETTVENFSLTPIPQIFCTEMLYELGCSFGDGLNDFQLADINNNESGCSSGGYGDFTAMSTNLSRGYLYVLSLSSNFSNQNVSVWIDLNDNFDFEESERLLTDFHLTADSTIYTTSLMINGGAPLGPHRLRARTNWNDPCTDPCAMYDYGEVEDYTVIIVDVPAFGDIFVSVNDEVSGVAIENATIEILGTSWFGVTEEEGITIINDVESGFYDILVSSVNYQDYLITGQYIFPEILNSLEILMTPLPLLTQPIMLQNGWQGLSSYIMPSNDDIAEIFDPILSNLVIVQNMDAMYWPDQLINTLETWGPHSGYIVKMSDDAVLNITGYPEMNKTFVLNSGWSILPVISDENVLVSELFGEPADENLVIVKEIAGSGVFWPALSINSLGYLQTGNAYMILMDNMSSVTFPDNPLKTLFPGENSVIVPDKWNIPKSTPNSHLIGFNPEILFSMGLSGESIIGAFTLDGVCAGMSKLSGEANVIVVYPDDIYTVEKEGFGQEEPLNFRIYDPLIDKDCYPIFEFDPQFPNSEGLFISNGISLINSMKWSDINDAQSGIRPTVYPNPTHGHLNIDLPGLNCSVKISDLAGSQLLIFQTSERKTSIDLSHFNMGIYFVEIKCGDQVFFEKIVLQ